MIPVSEQTIPGIVKISLFYFIDVFKKIWPILILFVLIKNLSVYCIHMIANPDLSALVFLIFFIILFFIFSLLLYQTNEVISGQALTLKQEVWHIIARFPRILLAYLFIFGLCFGTLFLARWLILLSGSELKSEDLATIIFFFLGLILLIEVLYFFFMVPLISADNETWLGSLIKSTEFLREDLRLVIFSYFSLMFLIILISPGSFHFAWISEHKLSIPFDLLAVFIFAPLILNIIIFTMGSIQNKIISSPDE